MKEFSFRKEDLSKIIFPMAIMACFIASYFPAFQKLMIRYNSGDNNYCYVILPLFLYLCWEKKDSFHFRQFSWCAWGILPIVVYVSLILVGEVGSVETLLYIGIWGCLVGLAVTFYGSRARFLIFPLLILLFIVPLPPFINRMLTFKLKMAASTLSVIMLREVGVSVMQEGNILDIGTNNWQVLDACSGLRYFVPMIPTSLLVGYFFVKGWWRNTILLLMVLPLSVVVNGFRMWLTVILTVNGHAELAQAFFHDFSGWVIFMIAGGLLVAAAFLLKKVGQNRPDNAKTDPGERAGRLVLPYVLTFMICGVFVGSGWALNRIPSAHTVPDRKSFDTFPMEIGGWKGSRHYISKEILNLLWADDYVKATYYKEDYPSQIYLLIPFYEYQGTRHTAHAPQACLLGGGGWALLNSNERIVGVEPHKEIKMMVMALEKGDTKLLSSYFFFQRGRVITSPWLNKLYLIWDAFTKKRTDGALVRVEMTVAPGQSIEEAYKVLEDFLSHLWEKLPEYVPG